MYVGSASVSFRNRWSHHRGMLRSGNHFNIHLQRAWNKYGEISFEFCILERCRPDLCIKIEQAWLDKTQAFKHGYNRSPTAGNCRGIKFARGGFEGKKHSEESKRKMAEASRGRIYSEETRRKIGLSHAGMIHTEEAKKKMSEARNKWKFTDETKAKMSKTHTGKKIPRDVVEKTAAWHRGRKRSEETRRRISEAMRASHARRKLQD